MKQVLFLTALLSTVTGCSNKATQPTPIIDPAQQELSEKVPIEAEQSHETSTVESVETKSSEVNDDADAAKAEELLYEDASDAKGILKADDEKTHLADTSPPKPIMVAVVAPMSGKNDMIGNAIMDGAHMSLLSLFEQHKVPVRIQVIDTGSSPEDMEFNISKLDEVDFDIILGMTSDDQESFVKAYIENKQKKPIIIPLNPHSKNSDCIASPRDQIASVMNYTGSDKKVYIVLPASEDQSRWSREGVEILTYSTKDVQSTNSDIANIAKTLGDLDVGKVHVVFTDGGWRLQKFMSQVDQNKVKVILANMSNLNTRMETVNSLRHRIGDIAVIRPDVSNYNGFMQEFQASNKRKPLELAFWSYNTVQNLKDATLENGRWHVPDSYPFCKLNLAIFETDN